MAGDQGESGLFPVQNEEQSSRQHLTSPAQRTMPSPTQNSSQTFQAPSARDSSQISPPQSASFSLSAPYGISRDSAVGSTVGETDFSGDFSSTLPGGSPEASYTTKFPRAGLRQGDYSLPRAKATNYGSSQPRSPSIMETAIAPAFSPPPPSDAAPSGRNPVMPAMGQNRSSYQPSQQGDDFAAAPSYVSGPSGANKPDTRATSSHRLTGVFSMFGTSQASSAGNPVNHGLEEGHHDIKCDDMPKGQEKISTSEDMQSDGLPKNKKKKWIIIGVVAAIVIIAVAVGGGIGGTLAKAKHPKADGASCDPTSSAKQCRNYCSSTMSQCQSVLSLNDACDPSSQCTGLSICSFGQCRNKSTATNLLPIYLGATKCTDSGQCTGSQNCLNSHNVVIQNGASGYCGYQGCFSNADCYGDQYFCHDETTSCDILTCNEDSFCVDFLNVRSQSSYAAVATCTTNRVDATSTSICSLNFASATAVSSTI